jgi:hypothetical protein
MPDTPAIDQVAVPVGVAEPIEPDTVAVKIKVDPRAALEREVVTTTAGDTFETTKLKAVLGPTTE